MFEIEFMIDDSICSNCKHSWIYHTNSTPSYCLVNGCGCEIV